MVHFLICSFPWLLLLYIQKLKINSPSWRLWLSCNDSTCSAASRFNCSFTNSRVVRVELSCICQFCSQFCSFRSLSSISLSGNRGKINQYSTESIVSITKVLCTHILLLKLQLESVNEISVTLDVFILPVLLSVILLNSKKSARIFC